MLPKLASALSLSPSLQSTSPTSCGTLKARQPPAPFADAPVQTSMLLLLTSSAVSRSNRPPVPPWLHSAIPCQVVPLTTLRSMSASTDSWLLSGLVIPLYNFPSRLDHRD